MNKITKRIVASLSAAAMIVSTFGSNSFSGAAMDSVYAEESNRKGRSTGFENLEQDTDGEYYNTGYGLHTNKTASVAEGIDDGRTFDVNLESWYVGENPVDVATILDASGSMAWTVNTLDPLKIDDFSIFDDYEKAHTGVTLNDITDLKKFQETNGGYLPQDVVDLILDKTQTDNSKLGYDKYKYYVYEDRSSVSEFVPLGYWDGGADPLADPDLIGYYPFSNDLKNKAPKALNDENAKGMLINHPDSDGVYDPTEPAAEKMEAEFSTQNVEQKDGTDKEVVKGLNIADSSSKGAIQVASPTTNKFSISFELSVDNSDREDSNGDEYSEATILYLTDGTNYYRIFRGGGGSAARLKMSSSKGSPLNANKAVNTEPRKWTFTFDFEKKELTVYTDTSTKDLKWVDDKDDPGKTINGKDTYTVSLADNPQLDVKNLKIYIGGDTTEHTNQNTIYIKNLTINNFNTEEEETPVAKYPLDKKENGLTNTVEGVGNAKFVVQAYNNGGTFGTSELTTNPLDPVFKDKKYLNVKETSQNGAVRLDAVPTLDDGFTVSMKLSRNSKSLKGSKQNIFYLGSSNTKNKYYQYFRSAKAGGYLGISNSTQSDFENNPPNQNDMVYYKGGMETGKDEQDVWYTNTLVFKEDSNDNSKYIVTPYINGKPKYQDGGTTHFTIDKISVDENLVFLLCALKENGDNGSNQYLDDLYVFNDALTETQVAQYFGEKESCKGSTTDKTLYHATTVGGDDIAQISESLAKNTKIDERRGWYYVNSHSAWADVTGCLASGKQYIGIRTDDGIDDYPDMKKDVATQPSEYKFEDKGDILGEIEKGNTDKEYEAPKTERSIRFYVDTQSHLRCFVWSGDTTKSEDNKRTFCSLVYEKKDNQLTKYEELNSALNTFYSNLAGYSDLSNTAVVRFSTVNAVDKNNKDTTNKNLKKLIMKDWTNWSDAFLNDDQKDKSKYLADLLIPADDEKSTDATDSKARPSEIQEYPYVMTGGTYTWTGLKSFYDNMVDKTSLESGNRVYDVANDARDKYLIIFTDGRDNTQDNTVDSEGNVVEGSKYKAQDYVKTYKPKDSTITKDGELAKAWADQLKAEGYTIYCVMLSTGSISPTANKEEYDGAETFLKTLAGSYNAEEQMADLQKRLEEEEAKRDGGGEKPDEKLILSLQEQIEELKKDPEKHIIIVNPSTDGGITVTDAFQQILDDIQQPRNDYTVQDYIDPRFDLVDKNGNLLKLGAGGKITIKYASGTESSVTVGDVIDNPYAYGYAYTPIASEMVNREKYYEPKEEKEFYTDGDGVGTGYIYYDDEKDMYYLRWEDQVIPMEDEAFDTTKENSKTLKVWSATIRLKAKDDFIGGNNILTNGNEAGENLVYSDATIENMDKGKNYELYGFDAPDLEDGKVPYRKKLEALSGTNRKINAVDAGGVSQAVYGNGIDIPSSGFPRVTVNVRLKPLNAKNLNDVIYMGEVVSPTMMLADLENDYMTGSYYLEYLERYAYRLYGEEVDKTPLLDLLNEWLKINNKDETAKTFTIPYIYLPDPVYENDKLQTDSSGRVKVSNSTGASWDEYNNTDFEDLNLRDVTGFITYTWKRNDGGEKQQEVIKDGETEDDITIEYVVKNTDQIVYNLQLKFTPLHEEDLDGFNIDEEKFITSTTGGTSDSFFEVDADSEFAERSDSKWEFTNRSEYLKAMVSEKKTYTPHVVYDSSTGKWKLLEDGAEVSDEDTYDWDTEYKKAVGVEQIEGDKLSEYYTDTLNNVGFADKDGVTITDETGKFITGKSKDDVCSLVANTTYTKDVVNGALALELVVDGKYLKDGANPQIKKDKTYTFTATRYYDDPFDPLPYDESKTLSADTGKTGTEGKQYHLTFKVNEDTLPKDPKDGEFYTVWAKLEKVEVKDDDGNWLVIDNGETDNQYAGYAKQDSLPIGTYKIEVNKAEMESNDTGNQYYIGDNDDSTHQNFQYLKIDNASSSYTYNRFPESVYSVSKTAKVSTNDSEYLIWDETTDNASKNIADNNRIKDDGLNSQTLTFYFGTVDKRTINGNELSNTIGYSRNDESAEEKDYAKDRLGIILLSANPNSLFISKEVTHIKKTDPYKEKFWTFTVTFTPNADAESKSEFEDNNTDGFGLMWYQRDDSSGTWNNKDAGEMGSDYPIDSVYPTSIKFTEIEDKPGTYTATIKLKHNQKVLINNLPSGIWQVTELDERSVENKLLYSAHNDMDSVDEYTWSNKTDEKAALPGSGVQFTNQFPFYILSAGGSGTYLYILCGGLLLLMASVLYYLSRLRKSKSRDKPDG